MGSTKARILNASAELFRRQGFGATGLQQVVRQANAPFGSLYHFFPGGKEQLGDEAIRTSGRMYLELIERYFNDVSNLPRTVKAFFSGAAEMVRATNFSDACPIATIALEVASTNETLRQATADVFESWIEATAIRLEAARLTRRESRQLAISLFCALEGSFVLARAWRDTTPILNAGEMAADRAMQAIAISKRLRARRHLRSKKLSPMDKPSATIIRRSKQ